MSRSGFDDWQWCVVLAKTYEVLSRHPKKADAEHSRECLFGRNGTRIVHILEVETFERMEAELARAREALAKLFAHEQRLARDGHDMQWSLADEAAIRAALETK